jgi:hypothetical protein
MEAGGEKRQEPELALIWVAGVVPDRGNEIKGLKDALGCIIDTAQDGKTEILAKLYSICGRCLCERLVMPVRERSSPSLAQSE